MVSELDAAWAEIAERLTPHDGWRANWRKRSGSRAATPEEQYKFLTLIGVVWDGVPTEFMP